VTIARFHPAHGLLACALLLATACPRSNEVAPASQAADGNGARTLVIGLIPEQNIFRQLERYQSIADFLSDQLGVKLRLTSLVRYGNIVDNFVSEDMDGAFFGSFTYALAHARIGVEVLARPLSTNGASTYHGLIFVRTDSKIRSVADMAGKRFAFVDRATMAGFLLPLHYFTQAGKDYRTFLRESYFAGTHEDVIHDVLDGKADIGAAKNTVFERMAAAEPRIESELTILDRSPEVPENALAVRATLDPQLKLGLKRALLTMHDDARGKQLLQAFGAQRFIETSDADYQPIYRYAADAKLDLATYNYKND